MIGPHYLDDARQQFKKLKTQGDRAMAQIADANFFRTPDSESNSVAIILKHVAGNMRSRWTDFLTTDGEKPDRNRDGEFLVESGDTRQRLMEQWEAGWKLLLDTLTALTPEHLERSVRVRGEAHTVLEAINRQMTHYAAHIGQIVYLAKHWAGSQWRTLSIPRGKSKEFEVAKDGARYHVR
ncbi:MAG TPA: DUF1572 family protein [Gemmatimonadales bacterium]|nr:DUF1572 family protein [Gemmatimonadales bacterium]